MLKKITRLLEQGGTMLASHHSCGAPLFRCKGQVVCPVCSFGEEGAAEGGASVQKEASAQKVDASGYDQGNIAQEEKTPIEEASINKSRFDIGTSPQEGLSTEEMDLRKAILRKLKELASGIEREQDLDKLRKQFDCIDAALKVLRSIER